MEFTATEATAGLLTEQDAIEMNCERLARTEQWLRATEVAEWPDGAISGRYSFPHAVYHEAAYARLTGVRRLQRHRCIAERKKAAHGERVGEIAAELAAHFVEGRYYHKAVQYLQQAGKNAVRRNAHQEAVVHFTRGLDLLTMLPDTSERKQYELALQVALGVPLLRPKGYAAPEVVHAYDRREKYANRSGNSRNSSPP